MARIWSMSVRGFKLSNATVERNVSFIQRGFAHVPKGDAHKLAQTPGAKEIFGRGEEPNMAEKTTGFFTRKSKPTSGGIIQMFSTAVTASANGPPKPLPDKGSGPGHNDQPVKGPKKPAEDTSPDSKNLHEDPESKK